MTELEKKVLKKVRESTAVDWLWTTPAETRALNRLVQKGILRFEKSTPASKGQWVVA